MSGLCSSVRTGYALRIGTRRSRRRPGAHARRRVSARRRAIPRDTSRRKWIGLKDAKDERNRAEEILNTDIVDSSHSKRVRLVSATEGQEARLLSLVIRRCLIYVRKNQHIKAWSCVMKDVLHWVRLHQGENPGTSTASTWTGRRSAWLAHVSIPGSSLSERARTSATS